jgi:hypothetical protein
MSLLFGSNPISAVNGSYGIKEFKAGIEAGGGYQYLKGRESPLSISTPASNLLNYSKDPALNNFIKDSNNANLTTGAALSGFNELSRNTQGQPRYLWGDQLKRK